MPTGTINGTINSEDIGTRLHMAVSNNPTITYDGFIISVSQRNHSAITAQWSLLTVGARGADCIEDGRH